MVESDCSFLQQMASLTLWFFIDTSNQMRYISSYKNQQADLTALCKNIFYAFSFSLFFFTFHPLITRFALLLIMDVTEKMAVVL